MATGFPHNTPYNNYFNCVVRRYITLYIKWQVSISTSFTIVCRPPRPRILILFMTVNILWHFHDLLVNFMTYAQFTKGVKVTLEDKLMNPIDWCKDPGCFQGYLGFQGYILFILLWSLLRQFSLQMNQHMLCQDQCGTNSVQKLVGNTKNKSVMRHWRDCDLANNRHSKNECFERN